MFLIAVDSSGRLLVENKPKSEGSNQRFKFCLPTVADSSSDNEILSFLAKIGFSGAKVIQNFELNLSTDKSVRRKYAICSLVSSSSSRSRYEVKSVDEIWQCDIDDLIAAAFSKIVEQVEHNSPGSVAKLEDE